MAKRRRSKKAPTAIVPRVVFQTVMAVSVVPGATGVVLAGCSVSPAVRGDASFSVAIRVDAGRDAGGDGGTFSVADVGPPPADADLDTAFSVADGSFSVAEPAPDAAFSVAFSVAVEPPDASS